jgi:hypothetical protein
VQLISSRWKGSGVPSPQPHATMLSRLLKEHQAKQNERKELQGEHTLPSAFFSPAAAFGPKRAGSREGRRLAGNGCGGERITGGIFGNYVPLPTRSGLLDCSPVPLGNAPSPRLRCIGAPPPQS